MIELIINKDFNRNKDQMEFPLEGGKGILIRDGEEFLMIGEKVWVYPGCTLIDLVKEKATIFVIEKLEE